MRAAAVAVAGLFLITGCVGNDSGSGDGDGGEPSAADASDKPGKAAFGTREEFCSTIKDWGFGWDEDEGVADAHDEIPAQTVINAMENLRPTEDIAATWTTVRKASVKSITLDRIVNDGSRYEPTDSSLKAFEEFSGYVSANCGHELPPRQQFG